jgi:hypothetical protein
MALLAPLSFIPCSAVVVPTPCFASSSLRTTCCAIAKAILLVASLLCRCAPCKRCTRYARSTPVYSLRSYAARNVAALIISCAYSLRLLLLRNRCALAAHTIATLQCLLVHYSLRSLFTMCYAALTLRYAHHIAALYSIVLARSHCRVHIRCAHI